MKKYIKCLSILFLLIILSGCVTEYNRGDVANYIKENIGINRFKISRTYKKLMGEDGYTDKLWKIYDKDKKLTFYVVDDHKWGTESVYNVLETDYYSKLFLKEVSNITDITNITYTNDTHYGLYDYVELKCEYENKNELKNCYTSFLKIKNHFNNGIDLTLTTEYNFPERNATSKPIDRADVKSNLKALDESIYEKMLYKYYYYGLSFHKESILAEITITDMNDILNNEETTLVYKTNANNDLLKKYDNVYGIPYGNRLSFSALYEVLKQEYYNITGNCHHFKVIYGNNSYEFSDDFLDYLYDNNEKGYYYLKNGEKIKFPYCWYNFVNAKDIKEMFNLDIANIENKFKNKYPY